MKIQVLLVALSVLSVHFTAQAKKGADNPACANIYKACEAAGFHPGDHKKNGKGLWVDCVGAIAKGKPVAGVSASEAEAKTCRDSRKAAKKKKSA